MRSIIAALLIAGTSLGPVPAVATPNAAPVAGAPFQRLATAYLNDRLRLHPSEATAFGNHLYDAQVNDLSAKGRARDVKFLRSTLGALERIDRSTLSRDEQVDAALLANELRYQLWQIETLQSWAWDPQLANEIISGSLYTLAARDFAPWPTRLKSAIARMEQIPAMYEQMRASLMPARVPLIHAQTVARQNGGVLDIVSEMLAPHRDTLSPADQRRFDAAVATLRQAVAQQQQWLDHSLVPNAKGDFRLGSRLYDVKLAFALVTDRTRTQIKADAQRAFDETRAEMLAIARTVLKDRPGSPTAPENPTRAQANQLIAAALQLTYDKRPARDGVMAKAEETLRQATAFVRAKQLVSVPDTPVQIIEMPKFRQGAVVAYCDNPGPLEPQLGTFYAISPIPADWTEQRATSFLREYNDYMLHELSIHEAMPGHYLQIAHANANLSPLRAVLASGAFAEGWAVYAERMMADEGYLDRDPLFRLTVLKMRLRSITNTLLDIGVHAEGMTQDRAMALMTQDAFQQEREAAGKWIRAQISSAQLLDYFFGYSEHVALRTEMEQKRGAGFDLKAYNDEVISHGTPPVRYVRALMTGAPID